MPDTISVVLQRFLREVGASRSCGFARHGPRVPIGTTMTPSGLW